MSHKRSARIHYLYCLPFFSAPLVLIQLLKESLCRDNQEQIALVGRKGHNLPCFTAQHTILVPYHKNFYEDAVSCMKHFFLL